MAQGELKDRSDARTAAMRRLRDAHPDDWNKYLAEEMGARGIEWEPRLNKEQKARREIRRLIEENPGMDLTGLVPD